MADSERIVRGTVTQSSDQNMREVQVNLQEDEVRDGIEHFEPYGFSSEPFIDGNTDALTVFFDDSREHGAVICVADRRYRIKALEKGEVVIYDDKKRKIYLKRDGILIDGADSPITVNTSSNVVSIFEKPSSLMLRYKYPSSDMLASASSTGSSY